MSIGSKDKYTDKQKRMAEHIEESYEEKGIGAPEATRLAWATVNKETGGGEKQGGSGAKKSNASKAAARKSVARNAASTRKHGRRVVKTASTSTKGRAKSK